MTNTVTFKPAPASVNDKLLTAIFVAIVIHVAFILGLNFKPPQPVKFNKSIAITLINNASEKAPDKANFLAQENQIAAGKQRQKATPPQKKPASRGSSQQAKIKPPAKTKKAASSKTKVIAQKHSVSKVTKSDDEQMVNIPSKPMTKLSTAMLIQQIAEVGITVRDKQLNAENSRIKFIDSVNAHQYKAAYYIKQWQNKVERIGNLNYPSIASKKGFSGKLLMDVGIKPDGSIYNIRIRKSSGYKALDEAAIKIVRMGAPYAALPKELLAEIDVLVISRSWQFSDETGMSAR